MGASSRNDERDAKAPSFPPDKSPGPFHFGSGLRVLQHPIILCGDHRPLGEQGLSGVEGYVLNNAVPIICAKRQETDPARHAQEQVSYGTGMAAGSLLFGAIKSSTPNVKSLDPGATL